MKDHLYQIINQLYISNLIWVTFLFFSFYIVVMIFYSYNSFLSVNSLRYKGKQRVHEGEIPRLGGLIIYLSLLSSTFFIDNSQFSTLQLTLFCLLPMIAIITKEDLTHNVDYRIRFVILIFTSMILTFFNKDNLPMVEHIIVISDLFYSPVFRFAFFTICLIALANGFNFIDGMNGLLSVYILGALMSCIQLSFFVQDISISLPIIFYVLLISLFLIINYPWGKLFLGDGGAYLMALLIGVWVIHFFSIYESISSWNAGLIFFYPIAEVSYSFVRKLLQKRSPFMPDREHLHLKVFDIINGSLKNSRLANNLTTFFLAIFWLAPPLILPWVYDNQLMVGLSLFVMSSIYIIINRVIPAYDNLKK